MLYEVITVKIGKESTSPKILMIAEEKTKEAELREKFETELEALKNEKSDD